MIEYIVRMALRMATSPTTYLGCRSYIAPWQPNIRRPCDVAHPVSMSLEYFLLDPRLSLFPESPDLDEVIAPGAGKAFKGCGRGWRSWLMGMDERAGMGSGRPRDGITADGMAIEDVGDPLAVVWNVHVIVKRWVRGERRRRADL